MIRGRSGSTGSAESALRALQALTAALVAVAVGLHLLRQPAINVVGFDRALVTAGVVAATAIVLAPSMMILFANMVTARSRFLWRRALAMSVPWWIHVGVWVALAVVAWAWGLAPAQYVATSLYYHAIATLLTAVPRALYPTDAVRLARLGTHVSLGVLVFACIQAVVPAVMMPQVLQPDGRTYIGTNALGVPRVNGLVGNPIEFAYFALLALHLFYVVEPHVLGRRLKRFGEVVALIALFLASSRLYLIAAVCVVCVWYWRRTGTLRRSLLLAAGVAAVAYAVWPESYVNRMFFNWSTAASTMLHVEESVAAFALFLESPWVGHGVGSETGPGSIITDGFWWAAAVETGVLGVATLLAVFLAPVVHVVVAERRASGTWRLTDRVVLVAGTAVFAIGSGVINSALYNPNNVLITFLLLGTAYLRGDGVVRDG